VYIDVMIKREYDLDYPFEPEIIVDAGANVGISSRWFASRFPRATIIAVEFEPSNFALLVRNTRDEPRVHPVHAALWPTPAQIGVAESAVPTSEYRAANGGSISAVTVSQLMEQFALPRIDLLKLDIEGAECEVLTASEDWIDDVRMIVAELHDRLVPGCTRAFMRATEGWTTERWRGENVLVAR
jgi:FkbM family methyltransferase